MAKTLIFFGILLVGVGLLLIVGQKMGLPLGKLPGDIHWQKGGSSFHFPLATSLVVSLFLTVVLNLLLWLFRR